MLKDHFRSRGFIEGGIVRNSKHNSMDMSVLPAFLRTLLVTDGTVTKSLEAYFWENVRVDMQSQEHCWLSHELPFIQARTGDYALKREVALVGAKTQQVYAYATSYLLTEFLDEQIKKQMLAGHIGIGELLREIGLETYREIVDMGRQEFNVSHSVKVDTVYRTYVINIGGNPAIQITERFPIASFTVDRQ